MVFRFSTGRRIKNLGRVHAITNSKCLPKYVKTINTTGGLRFHKSL
ncbi:hypothetical protein OROHE_005898 [Orobanche hederae]